MSAQNEIKIVFKGDDKLSDKIKKLDNATKKLLNTQAKIRDFNERIVKSNNKNKNSLKKLRIQLQLQGKEFKNLNIPLKMYKDALSGNDLALAKINQATKKYIANLKKQRNAQAKLVKHSEKNAVAIRKLRVKLLALGSDFDKAGISQSTLTRAMKGSQVAMEQLRNATRKFISTQGQATNAVEKTSKGLFGLGHSARNGTAELGGMGGAFSVLRSKLLLFNFAMGLGIRQVGKLVAEASKVNAMRTAFATLSGASDGLTISLKKITEATNGTMSEFNLFQQANNAMILGVTKNSDEMAEMFDMAQRLGRALGRDTRSSIESFVTGVGRQSRLMLDNIGLIVKSEVAYKAFASQVGKTTDELNEMEQKQAFLNAALVAGEIALRGIGTESLSSADKLQQMSAELTEVRQRIGDELLPMVLEMTKATKDFIEAIDGDDIRNAIAVIETLTVAFVSFRAIVTASQAMVALLALSFPQIGIILGLAGAIGTLAFQYQQSSKRALDLRNAQNNLSIAIKEARKELEDYSDFVVNFEKNRANAIAQIQAEADVRIEKNRQATESFIDYLATLKLGQAEIDEIRKLESMRLQARKKIEEEVKNLALDNKEEIINSLLEIEMSRKKAFLEDEQRLKRQEEFNKIKQKFNKLILNKMEKDEQSYHDKLTEMKKKASEIDDQNLREQIMLKIEALNIQSDAEIKKIDEMDAFFQEREKLKRMALGKTTLFQLAELDKLLDAFKEHGLTDLEFKKFLQDEYTRIVEEGNVERNKLEKIVLGDTAEFQLEQLNLLEKNYLEHFEHTLESEKYFADERKRIAKETSEAMKKILSEEEKNQIANLNRLAGAINALGGAFDVLADSQASATAKMSAFLRMTGGLLSVLGGTTPTGAFGGVLSAIGGAIGHTGGYIKQNGSIQRFAKGGMVLGQDNVPIMAQAGEFIMRKSAVDEIGVNTLAKLNKGETEVGNTVNTININIDGNIVGNEEFVRESLIPEIERTVQKGLA